MTISKKKKIITASGLALIIIAIFLVIYRGSAANYYLTPSELTAKLNSGSTGRVRLGGRVIGDSIGSDKATGSLMFKVGDNDGNNNNGIWVVYKGLPPDTFDPDAKVIVEGVFANGAFEADTLLVRCPENYLPEKMISGTANVLKVEGLIYR